jgi:hypothetical protein
VPTSQQSPHAGIEPEDVGTTVSYDEVYQPFSDAETQAIVEHFEDAIRGAPHLTRMYYENRSDPTNELFPPILFHDVLVEPDGGPLRQPMIDDLYLSEVGDQGDGYHNLVAPPYSIDPFFSPSAFHGFSANIIEPSFESPIAEIALDSQDAEVVEQGANGLWACEDVEDITQEEGYGI